MSAVSKHATRKPTIKTHRWSYIPPVYESEARNISHETIIEAKFLAERILNETCIPKFWKEIKLKYTPRSKSSFHSSKNQVTLASWTRRLANLLFPKLFLNL